MSSIETSCEKLLTVAVSTVRTNLPSVLEYISKIKDNISDEIQFLIVSQMESEDSSIEISGIRVFKTSDKGLSKSRNVSIDKCVTKWIWFQDDDINLFAKRIPALINTLHSFDGDLLLVQVASLENKDRGFKDYSRYNVNKMLLSFRVSSIEIIVDTQFLRRNNIKFDENLGLGSPLPSCEENLFFYDAIVMNNGKYSYYNKSMCFHTTLPEVRNIDYEGRYRARGYLLGKIGGMLSSMLLFWWGIRKTNDGVSRRRRLFLMLLEYVK